MKSIYDVIVQSGINFFFDFKEKTITYKKHTLMKGGELKQKTIRIDDKEIDLTTLPLITNEERKNPLEKLETLYQDFKFSIPYEGRKYLFYAESNLTALQLFEGKRRVDANNALEGFIFFAGPYINFDDNKWFWQGTDKELIIKKEWCK